MLDYDGDQHLYLQVAEIIRNRIADLAPGSRVPSESEIQHEFGVARTTARRAIHVLREEGHIYTVQGEGTFVGTATDAPRAPRQTPMFQQIADDIVQKIRSGEFPPKRRIPTESALVSRYGVARETARRGIALLREQGWIYTVPQRGSFVAPPESWPENR
ncbi:GntR family transcriptional regulator [Nonomuraea soli]|uniref:DNA-binding GntR family transcriptional regulator n=1 Tax=Nonomuraea soli TaxID=1032476 RepID=A0A7W0HMW9_9ACTN|nr:GntR family transcriptional regulator [Nonomuraea soli]MBA2888881.1 DNA-binding GntR family transcriptional regulator [Nonomuraea soli]